MTEEAYIKRLELENKILNENYSAMGGRQATVHNLEFMLAKVMYSYREILREMLTAQNSNIYVEDEDIDYEFYIEMNDLRETIHSVESKPYKKILEFIKVLKENKNGK